MRGSSADPAGRSGAAFALLLAVLITVAGMFQHGLWTPDEPREAEIGLEMLNSGFSPEPTLNREPFLEKPPLHPWLMAIGFHVFGVSDAVARIPAALAGVVAILLAFRLGVLAAGARAGVLSALVLATMFQFSNVSHKAINDSLLTAAVAGGYLAIVTARQRRRTGASDLVPFVGAGVCAGIAFMTKGVIGPVLLAGPPLLALLIMREGRFFGRATLLLTVCGGFFVLLFGVPWVLSLAGHGGWDAVRLCLVQNTLGRALNDEQTFGVAGHAQPPWYYLMAFPGAVAPWILVLPALLTSGVTRPDHRGNVTRVMAWTVLAGLFLLSLPAAKRELYATPLLPAGAVVVGVWLDRLRTSPGPHDRLTAGVMFALLCVLLAVLAVGLLLLQVVGPGTFGIDPELAPRSISLWLLLAVVAPAAWVMGDWARKTLRGLRPLSGARLAGAVYGVFLVLHLAIVPCIDPFKSMRSGALQAGAAVPGSGPLLLLCPDETTGAVLEFYTRRPVIALRQWPADRRDIPEGAAPFILVQEKRESQIPEPERASLEPAGEIRLSATRTLKIYPLR